MEVLRGPGGPAPTGRASRPTAPPTAPPSCTSSRPRCIGGPTARRSTSSAGERPTPSSAKRVGGVAEAASAGVGPGDSVALVLPNCPQNVIAFFAVLRLGATVVEHNPLYTAGELPAVPRPRGRVAIVWDKVVPVVEEVTEARRWSTWSPST